MKANEFKEAKIKMVMRLKKLTRRAAVAEIARMKAAKRKAAEEKKAQEAREEAKRKAKLEAAHERLRNRRNRSANIDRDDGFVSAKEFFGVAD